MALRSSSSSSSGPRVSRDPQLLDLALAALSVLRNGLTALRRFDGAAEALGTSLRIPYPFVGGRGGVFIYAHTNTVEVLSILVYVASAALLLKIGFANLFGAGGKLRNLHVWLRWAKRCTSGESGVKGSIRANASASMSTSASGLPAAVLWAHTLECVGSQRRRLLVGVSQAVWAHVSLSYVGV